MHKVYTVCLDVVLLVICQRERERERKGGWLKGGNAWCIALHARVTRRIFLLSIFLTRRGRRVDRDGKMEGGRNKGWVNASMTKWRLAGLIGGREKLPRPGGRESRYVARFNAWSGGFDEGERGRNTDGWKLTADKFVLKFSYLCLVKYFYPLIRINTPFLSFFIYLSYNF